MTIQIKGEWSKMANFAAKSQKPKKKKIQVGALLKFSILSTEQVCDQISEISTSIPGLLCYKNCLKKDLV